MTDLSPANIILNADSYKASHFRQYPPETTLVSSYIEARGGEYTQTVFFGLQMFLQQYLSKPITAADIDEAKTIIEAHGLPFNEAGWQHIIEKHNGYLPLEIQALPEGSVVPTQTALVQVINTDPECAWLTSYIETALLRAVWYPTTVATLSWHCRQTIQHALMKTADTCDGLDFKLHDFGARGPAVKNPQPSVAQRIW
ncbi:nicotinamide phosphoribosyltransferase domain-containing protein [Aliamphritea spongicola]|nr:nicotinamide phosphoribosyltransferase domain-containing protein [Aliamphritea spongicola]